ncbi:MAG: NAD(P)-dependent alcohol dehydrogenase [Propionibacteriaceae bacterium]|uniref:Polyketide synthase, enoylreductase domain n=2 Tax=Propionibacterium ruminifibrarum TaxID=1962131 RepID=A0A375I071_9ACTN|nr:NAD(P)-dependent alcohol dehydrogenase [Propionibacteriaceae bacterium]SPF67467.1 Polyketide synthase, enoylreductase domain [Propionibacterium ruminifibrarum]
MKGYAMLRIGEAGWIEKAEPVCGPLDAVCRPVALAPCSSDIHTVYEGGVGERHDMVLGHEAVGEVVEVGTSVRDIKVGDRVIIPAITPDWSSIAAQDGYPMHSGGALGGWKFSNTKDGVFAEFIHVNDADANLAVLPEGIPAETGAMLSDMATTGLHGAELAQIRPGDTTVVIGIGPVGLMSVAGAAILGAGRLFAVGSRPTCIEVAKQFGATDIVNYREGDIVEQIMEATGGRGVDRVVVAGGDLGTFQQAFDVLKPGGRIGNVNYLGEGDALRISRESFLVGMGHKHLVGGLTPGGRRRMERMTELVLAGRIHPEKMITHRFTGLEHVEDGVELMRQKPRDLIKPVITV